MSDMHLAVLPKWNKYTLFKIITARYKVPIPFKVAFGMNKIDLFFTTTSVTFQPPTLGQKFQPNCE